MFSEKNLNEVSAASQADVFNTEVLPDGGLAITGYNGNSENVTIPASVSGRKVVEIKSLGKMNSSIKSLRITDGVKKSIVLLLNHTVILKACLSLTVLLI